MGQYSKITDKEAVELGTVPPPGTPLEDVITWHIGRSLEANKGRIKPTARQLRIGHLRIYRRGFESSWDSKVDGAAHLARYRNREGRHEPEKAAATTSHPPMSAEWGGEEPIQSKADRKWQQYLEQRNA